MDLASDEEEQLVQAKQLFREQRERIRKERERAYLDKQVLSVLQDSQAKIDTFHATNNLDATPQMQQRLTASSAGHDSSSLDAREQVLYDEIKELQQSKLAAQLLLDENKRKMELLEEKEKLQHELHQEAMSLLKNLTEDKEEATRKRNEIERRRQEEVEALLQAKEEVAKKSRERQVKSAKTIQRLKKEKQSIEEEREQLREKVKIGDGGDTVVIRKTPLSDAEKARKMALEKANALHHPSQSWGEEEDEDATDEETQDKDEGPPGNCVMEWGDHQMAYDSCFNCGQREGVTTSSKLQLTRVLDGVALQISVVEADHDTYEDRLLFMFFDEGTGALYEHAIEMAEMKGFKKVLECEDSFDIAQNQTKYIKLLLSLFRIQFDPVSQHYCMYFLEERIRSSLEVEQRAQDEKAKRLEEQQRMVQEAAEAERRAAERAKREEERKAREEAHALKMTRLQEEREREDQRRRKILQDEQKQLLDAENRINEMENKARAREAAIQREAAKQAAKLVEAEQRLKKLEDAPPPTQQLPASSSSSFAATTTATTTKSAPFKPSSSSSSSSSTRVGDDGDEKEQQHAEPPPQMRDAKFKQRMTLLLALQQSPCIAFLDTEHRTQMSHEHLDGLLKVGGNLARVMACLTSLENREVVLHTRTELVGRLRDRDYEEVVSALQQHPEVYPGVSYAKSEKKITLSQVKRLLNACGSVALVWDVLSNMSKNKVTTSNFDALLRGVDSLKQVCVTFLRSKQCTLLQYSSYKGAMTVDTLNDLLRAGATFTNTLQLLYRFQQQGTSFINLGDLQKALLAEKRKVVAFLSQAECQLFTGIEGLEIISRDLDEVIQRGGTIDQCLACLTFLNKRKNRYENMLDLRAAVASASRLLKGSDAPARYGIDKKLFRAFEVQCSAYFLSADCMLMRRALRAPPGEETLLRILQAAKTPSRAMSHLRLLNGNVARGDMTAFSTMELLIGAMEDMAVEQLTQELMLPDMHRVLQPALNALPASTTAASYLRSGVSLWRERKVMKANRRVAHVCDVIADLNHPVTTYASSSDRKAPDTWENFEGLREALLNHKNVVIACLEHHKVLPSGVYLNAFMLDDLVTLAGTPTHLLRIIERLAANKQKFRTYSELAAEVKIAFDEAEEALLGSGLIVSEHYPNVRQNVVREDVEELLYKTRRFQDLRRYLSALKLDAYHFGNVQEIIRFAAADDDEVRLLRANEPTHKLLKQLDAVRGVGGSLELIQRFLASPGCVLFAGKNLVTPTHVAMLLQAEPSCSRLLRRLKYMNQVVKDGRGGGALHTADELILLMKNVDRYMILDFVLHHRMMLGGVSKRQVIYLLSNAEEKQLLPRGMALPAVMDALVRLIEHGTVVQSIKQMTRAIRSCKADIIEYLASPDCGLLSDGDVNVSEVELDALLAAGATVTNTIDCLRDLNFENIHCDNLQDLAEHVRVAKMKPFEYLRSPECSLLVPVANRDALEALGEKCRVHLGDNKHLERDVDDMVQRMGTSHAVYERLQEMTREDLYVPSVAELYDALPVRPINYPKSHSHSSQRASMSMSQVTLDTHNTEEDLQSYLEEEEGEEEKHDQDVPDAFMEMTPTEQVSAYLYNEEAVLFNRSFLDSVDRHEQEAFVEEMLERNVSVAMFLYKLRYLDGLVRSGKGGALNSFAELKQALDGMFKYRVLDFLLSSNCFDLSESSDITKGSIIFTIMNAPVEQLLMDVEDIDASLPIAMDALYSCHFDTKAIAFSSFDEFFEYIARFPLQVSTYLETHFGYLFDDTRDTEAAVSMEDVHHLILAAGTVTSCLQFLERVVEKKGNTVSATPTIGDLMLSITRRMRAVKTLLTKPTGKFCFDANEVLDSDVAMLVARAGGLSRLIKILTRMEHDLPERGDNNDTDGHPSFGIIGELIDDIHPKRRT